MSVAADLDARLAELRAAYVAALPGHAARFRCCFERLLDGDSPELRSELREIAHRLAGTGALYGFDELTAWGRASERLARTGTLGDLRAAADELDGIIARALR